MFNSFIFVTIFNQIYAALVSTRDILKKKVLMTSTFLTIYTIKCCVCVCVFVCVCVCVCVNTYLLYTIR